MKVARLHEALEIIKDVAPLGRRDWVTLEEACGRVASKEQEVVLPLPSFDNSAMDGYAIRAKDAGLRVRVAGRILAGDQAFDLQERVALRIMTGAPIPEGCDTIVPQEEVVAEEGWVGLPATVRQGSHIRRIGEDLRVGERILEPGESITPVHIGMAASQGITHLQVYGRPRVVVLATGAEVRFHFEQRDHEQLFNSNTPTLVAWLKSWGCEVSVVRVEVDDQKILREAVEGLGWADLIVTTGGASVGEADLTREVLREVSAHFLFDKISLKPGKPTALARLGGSYVLMLPGNPMAAMVNFLLLGRSLVRRLSGRRAWAYLEVEARLGSALTFKGGVDTVIAGFFDGYRFMPKKRQASFMVSGLAGCNALIVVDRGVAALEEGTRVKVLVIDWESGADEIGSLVSKGESCSQD
ncbi:MAG: molybdopterin molybdotransferase MoeA [Campylobacterales bacterium]